MRLLLLLLLFSYSSIQAQIITGTYDFQSDPAKKYALYIPTTYDAQVPSKVIVGLHPWNVTKWDAESWAEELSELAELNNTIIICPDGGIDGQIDDDIDTALTTFLIDQVALEYNLDSENMYLVGFSWGARTVYTYGLTNKTKFKGFMPIGAAVDLSVIGGLVNEVEKLPFYIIHGSLDDPNTRFYPIRDALIEAEACVETNLLQFVGHTIEFPDQLNILNTGFQWMLDNNCASTNSFSNLEVPELIKQQIFTSGDVLSFNSQENQIFKVFDVVGNEVKKGNASEIKLDLIAGNYFISIQNNRTYRIIVR